MMYLIHWVLKALKYLILLLFALFVVWFALALYQRINAYRVCAKLPNGLLIGYAALFDPQEYLWTPNVVLKLPDGTILIPENVGWFYFSETTVYGSAEPKLDAKWDYAFAYRPDVGLILEKDEPDRYKKLKNEAGQLIWIYGDQGNPVHTGLMGTYYKSIEDPAFRREGCPITLFPKGTYGTMN